MNRPVYHPGLCIECYERGRSAPAEVGHSCAYACGIRLRVGGYCDTLRQRVVTMRDALGVLVRPLLPCSAAAKHEVQP